MDLIVIVEQRSKVAAQKARAFANDVRRLLVASPVFGGAVVGTGIILGGAPILLWQYFGNFIDACFGARGVGTMTTDLSHNAVAVGIVAAVLIGAGAYFAQTQALSRRIASTIALSIFFVTHIVALLPVEKSFLVFLCILAIGFRFAHHRAARILMTCVLGLLATVSVSDILLMMTRRSLTVGSAVEYCAIILSLSMVSAYMAHRRA